MKGRWLALCQRLGLQGELDAAFERLWSAYHQPGRHYHDWSHIESCLTQLDSIDEPLAERDALEMAIWYHDAVYNPKRGDNEAESARWALELLEGALGERVVRLVMVTRDHQADPGSTEAWMVDIDLSILGAPTDEYDRYEANIRKEYGWVPWFLYRSKRKAILKGFAQRNPLYRTAYFRVRREAQAHRNLDLAVAKL